MNRLEHAERAIELIRERAQIAVQALAELQGPDGESYGMAELEGAEFLAFYRHLEHFPIELPPLVEPDAEGNPIEIAPMYSTEANLLEYLEIIAPKYTASLARQYERELAKIQNRVA